MEKLFNMEQIGRNISLLRRKIGMTQMELADKLLISFQAVSSWERGITMPDIGKLPLLSEILGVSTDEILSSTKGAEILESISKGSQPESVTAEEIVEIAPVMKPEQVDMLVNSLEGSAFTKDQAESLAPLMAFNGDFDRPIGEIAEKAYDNSTLPYLSVVAPLAEKEDASVLKNLAFRALQDNKIAMLSTMANSLDDETVKELAIAAFENNNIAIFSSLSHRLEEEVLKDLALRAFDDENIAIFSSISHHLDEAALKKLALRAYETGKAAFFGNLVRYLQ